MNENELKRIEDLLDLKPTVEDFATEDDVADGSTKPADIVQYNEQPLVAHKKKEGEILSADEKKHDIESVRRNLFNLVNKSKEAVDGSLQVAQESDSPRAYEVVAGLIKSSMEVNQAIIDMHEKVNPAQTGKQETNIEQAVFVGSPAELQKMLKQAKETQHGEED